MLFLFSMIDSHKVAGPIWIHVLTFPQIFFGAVALDWTGPVGISKSAGFAFFSACAIPVSLLYGAIVRLLEDIVRWAMVLLSQKSIQTK